MMPTVADILLTLSMLFSPQLMIVHEYDQSHAIVELPKLNLTVKVISDTVGRITEIRPIKGEFPTTCNDPIGNPSQEGDK